jgi:uncharacterized HAD superfamily protein
MKIGIELMGTLLDELSAAEGYFGSPQQREASTFDEMYPLISDADLSSWRSSKRTYEKMPVVEGALHAMDIISQKHEMCGITSIDKHLMNTVANWLLKNSVAVTGVSHTKNKDISAKLSKIDVFIESDAESARRLSKVCRVIILDSPYNRFGAGSKVERAYSWEEILEKLND